MRNALKAIGSTDDELRVGNYIVLYGDERQRDLEGLATPRVNPDGTTGEFFTKATRFDSPLTAIGRVPLDWEHNVKPDKHIDGRRFDPGPLGYVDWKTATSDDLGVWVERVLDRRNKYVHFIERLIDAGMIGTSSASKTAEVMKTPSGEVLEWPIYGDTLTVTPMEPRMLTENAMRAAKALGLFAEEPEPEAEAEDAASVAEAVKAVDVQPTITTEEETMAEENVTMSRDELKALVAQAAQEAAKAMTPVSRGGYVVEDEMDKAARDPAVPAYKNLGEQLMDVKRAGSPGEKPSPRLLKAQKAVTGMSEGVPADGGFLVQTDLVAELMRPVYATGDLLSRVRKLEISGNANSVEVFGVNETSRATGSRWGGVRGYHLAEADEKTASHPTFRKVRLNLEKTAVLVYATDEVLQDVGLLNQVIGDAARDELKFMAEDDIVNGTGVGMALGILNAPCLVQQAAEALQGDTVVAENIIHMWSRRWAPGRYAWFINQEVEPWLQMMDLPAGGAGQLVYMPAGGLSALPYATLNGAPVLTTEYNAAIGDLGDIVLADMSQYFYATKAGIQEAMSIHVHFIYDESVFRFVMRNDGQPSWGSALTPYKATAGRTVSPFVALAAR